MSEWGPKWMDRSVYVSSLTLLAIVAMAFVAEPVSAGTFSYNVQEGMCVQVGSVDGGGWSITSSAPFQGTVLPSNGGYSYGPRIATAHRGAAPRGANYFYTACNVCPVGTLTVTFALPDPAINGGAPRFFQAQSTDTTGCANAPPSSFDFDTGALPEVIGDVGAVIAILVIIIVIAFPIPAAPPVAAANPPAGSHIPSTPVFPPAAFGPSAAEAPTRSQRLRTLAITPQDPSVCPNKTVMFTAVGAPASTTVTWVGGDDPASGMGPTFATRFRTSGKKIVHASARTDTGEVSAIASVTIKELTGGQWVSRFPGSSSTADLTPNFGRNVERFIAALREAGATVAINATYRPPERAYLMHYAYRIAREGLDPETVPAMVGVEICWVHRDADGKPDVAASKAAAQQMVTGYRIAHRPHLQSRHIERRAIDMTIIWSGDLIVAKGNGERVPIKSSPRDGAGNTDLHAIGATYGVIKLVSDAPHWSDDGH